MGFALTAAGELDNYHKYLLEAASIAEDLRKNPGKHGEALVFTTHPYIVNLLLHCPQGTASRTGASQAAQAQAGHGRKQATAPMAPDTRLRGLTPAPPPPGFGFSCPTAAEQATMRAALQRGDIVMQAFPHNAETATFTPDFFKQALQVRKAPVLPSRPPPRPLAAHSLPLLPPKKTARQGPRRRAEH